MTKSKNKSRTFRRVAKRAVSGSTIHYTKKRPPKSHCGACGAVLKGTPSHLPFKLKKLSKTHKRPQRPFGGVLCSRCSKLNLKMGARKQND